MFPQKVLDFVKQKTLIISPIKYNDKNDKFCYATVKPKDKSLKWYQMNFVESMTKYNDKMEEFPDNQGLMINLYGLYNKYICFDADDEKANNFMLKFISDNGLNKISTKSLRHITQNLTYKNHYYFKLANNISIEDVEKKKQFENHEIYGNLDILFLIAEHKNSEIDYENISEISEDLILPLFKDGIKEEEEENNEENDEEVDENKIKELLKLFKPSTGNKHEEWMKIGSAIKSIDEYAIKIFDEFSKTRENYNKSGTPTLKQHWKSWKKLGGWGALVNIATADNPEGIKKWQSKWNKKETKENNDEEYNKIKEQFKDRLFIIESPIIYGYINEDNETIFYQLKDLKQLLKPYKIGKREFIELWLEDNTRKTFSKIDFIPNNTNRKIYNNFRGFKYANTDEINMDKIQPYLDLINTLLNNEEVSINSFLDWWAWIRQRPNQKTEKAVVLYSDVQGVGKNTLIQFFTKVITYSTTVNDIKDLVKNFNTHITNKLVICGDEVKVKAREIRDDLKNMITRTEMIVEKKCVDAYQINDYSNYIFTTNNQTAFYIEPTDRRFILFQLADVVMTEETSKILYALMKDEEALKSMDTFLKDRIIPEKLKAPENEYKKLLKANSLPAYIQMIYRQPNKFYNEEMTISTLYDIAINYAKQHGLEWTFSAEKMSRDFKAEFQAFFRKRKDANKYVFPKQSELIEWLESKRPQIVMEELPSEEDEEDINDRIEELQKKIEQLQKKKKEIKK